MRNAGEPKQRALQPPNGKKGHALVCQLVQMFKPVLDNNFGIRSHVAVSAETLENALPLLRLGMISSVSVFRNKSVLMQELSALLRSGMLKIAPVSKRVLRLLNVLPERSGIITDATASVKASASAANIKNGTTTSANVI